MMRLHEMQVRMAPMLRWAIAGPPSTTITQVISPTVRVSTMVIPARDRLKILSNSGYNFKRVDVSDAAALTSLFSCVSAGDSRHVLAGWISPSDLCHNPGTHRDYVVPCPCPTPLEIYFRKYWIGIKQILNLKPFSCVGQEVAAQGSVNAVCDWQSFPSLLYISFLPVVPVISAPVFPLSWAVIVTSLPSEFIPSPAVVVIITVSHLHAHRKTIHDVMC